MFLASRALNPIDQITRTADAISAEDLSRRLGVRPASDEVGRLAATFDHMLDRLEQAFQRQRQFTSDASHELRTPLSMLVSRAGLALQRQRTVAEYEDVLRAVRDEGLHMGRIVNDLLMLARADAGNALALSEQLDLGELVGSVAEAMGLIADTREIHLSVAAEDGVRVVGDQTRLTQLLVNLVDNALAHTPAGGQVELRASHAGSQAILQVTDTGAGIAAEDLPHVFQRFFRAHGGRSRDGGGAGLGLALCQSIVQAHGGEISLESELGRGTRVTVRLPLIARATANGHAAPGERRGDALVVQSRPV
jgi:heavy metal sensor kinase